MKTTPKISLKKGAVKANNLLEMIFSNTNFEYDFINGKTFVVKRKYRTGESPGLSQPISRVANRSPEALGEITKEVVLPRLQLAITGTVTDVAGEPLPGATIVEKGTTNGAQTDFDETLR